MRQNAFGDKILQPSDKWGLFEEIWEERFDELPQTDGAVVAEINPEFDENYKIGGELRNASSGEGVGFDGFETIEAARTWLETELSLDPSDIEVLDE